MHDPDCGYFDHDYDETWCDCWRDDRPQPGNAPCFACGGIHPSGTACPGPADYMSP